MAKAVIFDFDGVIADAEPMHMQAFIEALKADYDITLTKELYYGKYLGYTDVGCVEHFNEDFSMNLTAEQQAELIAHKTERFEEMIAGGIEIIPGVLEFIELLEANSVPMAICTGATARDIELMLDGRGLNDKFLTVVAADHVSNGKPHPQGYLMAVERINQIKGLSLEPCDCIAIEDSHWGLESAGAAGLKRIAVTNTYPADELAGKADLVVDTLAAIDVKMLGDIC